MNRLICFLKGHKWEYFSKLMTTGRHLKLKYCTCCGSVKKANMIEYIIGTAGQSAGTQNNKPEFPKDRIS